MKTKEEWNVLKKEAEVPENKLADLNEEELASVTGGVGSFILDALDPNMPSPESAVPRDNRRYVPSTTGGLIGSASTKPDI